MRDPEGIQVQGKGGWVRTVKVSRARSIRKPIVRDRLYGQDERAR